MDISSYTVDYFPMPKEYGKTEDGYPLVFDVFHMVIETDGGIRYISRAGIPTVRFTGYDEDGFPVYLREKEQAEAKAQRMVKRIREVGVVDLDNWYFDPVYGSQAYIDAGAEEWRMGL